MEEEKKGQQPGKSIWTHGAKVGLGTVREAVRGTRDTVASSIDELQRELRKKRAVLARFGKR
jgi:hypothetical protein